MRLLFLALAFVGIASCGRADPSPSTEAPTPSDRPHITEHMTEPAILVFSRTLGWRHNEGIAGADKFFVEISRDVGFGIFTTENPAVFNAEDLARFDVVVFNNMTGNSLSEDQQAAFQTWLEAGGGWIGIHGAGDASQADWTWYQKSLIGPKFIGHPADPQFQNARIDMLATAHPIAAGIPSSWEHVDEWYSFDGRAQDHGALVIAGLDESTYRPRNDVYGDVSDLRMGDGAENHPIMWVTCPGAGRAFYTAVGHSDETYDSKVYRMLLGNAFRWVIGQTDPERSACP